ncbi:MAG TPA: choice-of-anchor tandem repeat GloVer-containing protein, partial [Rhizomicrobium sp.]|nr:choice-of-anchor tandem repeat GloVer-containing protein [Rhizomicrobium sp.]
MKLASTLRILAALAASTLIMAAVSLSPAQAAKLKTIYSFCAQANCTDGSDVRSLIVDQSGTLYGTTFAGGQYNNGGTIFELSQGKGGWTFTQLYSFCQDPSCP